MFQAELHCAAKKNLFPQKFGEHKKGEFERGYKW